MKRSMIFLVMTALACFVQDFLGQDPKEFPRVPFDRYQLHKEMTDTLKKWQEMFPGLAKLHSIGKSFQGKDLWLLEVTNFETGPGETKPGFWIDGSTHPDEPCGAPMVMHAGQTLLLGFGKDPHITELMNSRVFYILPKVNPDGTDYYLTQPGMISHAQPWDEDGDGLVDEDPAEDLNGDGAITLMRIKDESGPLRTSPLDKRLFVVRQETEKGEYRVLTEGLDNDGDGRFNEDGVGGININRNYPYEWNPAQRGSGAHPLSVPESRAVVEFIAAHPNISGCYSVHGGGWPVNFLVRPPANAPDESLPEFDLDVFEAMSAKFREITAGDLVESLYEDTIMGNRRRPGNYGYGLFLSWTYHALGLYSFSPEMCGIAADYDSDGKITEIEMLRWSDEKKGGKYFINWKPFDHPQLGPVEIGGWVQKIAPIDAGLEKICREYTEFNLYQAALSPLIKIHSVKKIAVSDAVFKIEAVIANAGFLPTYLSQTALKNKRDYPVIVDLNLENVDMIMGKTRTVLGHLEGNMPKSPGYFLFSGESAQLPSKTVEWVIKAKKGGPARIKISVSCAKGGRDARVLEIK